MHLNYNLISAHMSGEKRHAERTMQDLGISYLVAVPQPISDSWWFFCCEDVPDSLPKYLTQITCQVKDLIGWGLSPGDVDRIIEYEKKGKTNA